MTTFTIGWSLALYLGGFLLTCLFGYLYSKTQNKFKRIIYLTAIWAIPTLIAGLRVGVGTDYKTYASEFSHNSFKHYDPASRLIFAITRFFTDNPQAIFTVFGGITNLFITLSVIELKKKNPKSIPLFLATYLLVFFPLSLNIMRQGLALTMVIYSSLLAFRRARIPAIAVALCAMLAHTTAIFFFIFIVVYIFYKPKHVSRNIIILTVLIIIALLLSSYLRGLPLVGRYFGYLRIFSLEKTEPLLLLSYIPFLLIAFSPLAKRLTPDLSFARIAFVLGALFEFVLSSTHASRCALYLSAMSTIFFPGILANMQEGKHRKIAMAAYGLFIVGYFVVVFCIHGRARVFPYGWVF